MNKQDNTLITERTFELDGEEVDIFSFVRENQFSDRECKEIVQLSVGEQLTFGGGAAPERTLKRTS